jgi:hypothetical protein
MKRIPAPLALTGICYATVRQETVVFPEWNYTPEAAAVKLLLDMF